GAGVRALVPVSPPTGSSGVSATSVDAFGAVALSLPSDAPALAATLVHEFQHTKLSALLDLVPLLRPDRTTPEEQATSGKVAQCYAPWRPDPRPLSGLLQGVYAHLGLCGFWHERYRAGGRDVLYAAFELVRSRDAAWR